jgi:hypothetical protein
MRIAHGAVPTPAALQRVSAVLSSVQIFMEAGLVVEAVEVLPASGIATIEKRADRHKTTAPALIS